MTGEAGLLDIDAGCMVGLWLQALPAALALWACRLGWWRVTQHGGEAVPHTHLHCLRELSLQLRVGSWLTKTDALKDQEQLGQTLQSGPER